MSKSQELATRQVKALWWSPAINRHRDQTGIAHVVHGGSTLCGARPFDQGASFKTPEESGAAACRRCLKIVERSSHDQ